MKLKGINAIIFAFVALTLLVVAESVDGQDVKEELGLKFEIQNDQQHDSDEQFVAVHVNRLGIEILDPSMPSIKDLVETFLPKKLQFQYAINVTREIVNGFKYEVFYVMKNDESDEEIYCLIDILEKPWLIKGSKKFRKMTFNNCSLTNPVEDIEYDGNSIFINHKNDLSKEDLIKLEDQIISLNDSNEDIESSTMVSLEDITLNPSSKNILDNLFSMQNFIAQTKTTSTTTSSLIPHSNFNITALDEIFKIQKQENTAQSIINNETLRHLEVALKKAFSELFQSDPEFQMNIISLVNSKEQREYNQIIEILGKKLKDKIESYYIEKVINEQIQFDTNVPIISRRRRSNMNYLVIRELNCISSHLVDVFTCADCFLKIEGKEAISSSKCIYRREKRQGLGRRKKNDYFPGGARSLKEDDPALQRYLTDALAQINADEDPDYELKRIVEASFQVVAGSLYKIKVEMHQDGHPIICNFEVWERVWIPDGREVKVECENDKSYNFKQAPVKKINSRKRRSSSDSLVGGANEIDKDDEDVKELLSQHLSRLDTGSETSLKLSSIEKITRQVVAGIKYVITGDFKLGDDSMHCNIEIWHRAWIKGEDGTQLNAKCDNEVQYKTRSRSVRSIHHHRFHKNHRQDYSEVNHDRHHHSEIKQMEEVKSEIIFENFVQKYARKYANDVEKNQRLRIFKKNLNTIAYLNKHEQGTAKYGITEFADMTEKEYLRKTGLIVSDRHENSLGNPTANISDVPLPEEFDWREKGVITNVKNQGNCGSCWSFSVTGNIEGLHAIKTGKLEAYSEQLLLDCDTTDNACNGGYMDDAFKAIEKIGGLELETDYPYLARKQKKCLFNQTLSHVKVKGVVDIPKGDEIAMQKFLVSTGPISIGINANAMQFYRGGISHPWKVLCRKSNLDHGVLIVGYGKKEYPMFNKTLPYWTIKNSWGPTWGEQGYYRVYRGDNTCGVAEMASSAVLE